MTFLLRSVLVLAFAVTTVAATGCSSEPKKYKASGTVKYKGNPLPDGSVTFIPEGGSTSGMGATSIKDGAFAFPPEAGLLPGKYKVSVSRPDPKGAAKIEGDAPGASQDAAELIPAKYNAQTELTAEIKAEGPNEFPFDLK